MASPPPIPCVYEGGHFVPLRSAHNIAAAHYGEGEIVTLAPVEDRSSASHRHYFAAINEAWQNLPESWLQQLPTADHPRKYALIKAGYADHRSVVCTSKAEALRMAAFIKPMDTFAVVAAQEATVSVWTAQSQSMRAMGKQRFQESKDAVLTIVAEMIGVQLGQLTERARAA